MIQPSTAPRKVRASPEVKEGPSSNESDSTFQAVMKKMQHKMGKKKILKKVTAELRKKVVEMYELGIWVTDLSSEYEMAN